MIIDDNNEVISYEYLNLHIMLQKQNIDLLHWLTIATPSLSSLLLPIDLSV